MGFDFDKYDDAKDKARAKRLKEKRIKRHDPGPKVKVNWNAERRKRRKSDFLIVELWQALPAKYRGGIVGGFFGLFALVPSLLLFPGWYKLLGIPIFFICIFGVMMIWTAAENLNDV